MTKGKDQISDAFQMLDEVLGELEQVIDNHLENAQSLQQVEEEVQRMVADRGQMAEGLDSVSARAQRLEDANREVSRRLVAAMENIRGVIDGN